jgi:uroporphyrinogen decarboxylase
MQNTTFLDALNGKPTTHAPIWLMRQAGRYLPEYIKTRSKAGSFMALAQNKDLATEVTLQPLARYDLDAAILFSDILTIPDAMGLGLSFAAGEGPQFANPLRSEQDILNLQPVDMHKLQYVFDAVSSIIKALRSDINDDSTQKLPLIGFSGSPFTLACYMIEGSGSSNNFELARTMMYSRPDLFKILLDKISLAIIDYLDAQIQAGVNSIMLFDTWGGLLSCANYFEYSLAPLSMILRTLKDKHPHIPNIMFTKGGGLWIENIAFINHDILNCIGTDWTIDMYTARSMVPKHMSIQGNLDPIALLGSTQNIERQTKDMLDKYYAVNKNLNGYIANLGHGISKNTNPENVHVFVQTVKNYSRQLMAI